MRRGGGEEEEGGESLYLPTDCQNWQSTWVEAKKVGQTYVTGATGQARTCTLIWLMLSGSLSAPLSLPPSPSLAVCSALSKHVTGMPRLRVQEANRRGVE